MTLGDEVCCPECSSDICSEFLGDKLPKEIFYCSDCEKVYIIRELKIKLRLGKEIDEVFKDIGLDIELLF